MYEHHWRLSRKPFDERGDAASFVSLPTHLGALLKLRYLLDEGLGAALLVGDHGVGKSFLVRVLEAECLQRGTIPVVKLVIPQLSPQGLLAYWAQRLGVPISGETAEYQVLIALELKLEELCQQGQHPLFVVDDAHLLEAPHLHLLRLLLNLRESGTVQFSILLTGRPELIGQLKSVSGLDQRVCVRAAVEPLTARDTEQYLATRLRNAGGTGREFTPPAAYRLWQLSQGIPRRINQLADLALLVGFADELQSLTATEVDAAAEELISVSLPLAA